MIEVVRTFTGHTRANGQVKVTVRLMYRCEKCGTIKPTFKELVDAACSTLDNNH